MRRSLVCILAAASTAAMAGTAHAELIVGLTGNSLVTFDSAVPGTLSSPVTLSGLAAGTIMRGIDFRPSDGQLIGVGTVAGNGTVYAINPLTGVASVINTGFVVGGSAFGVDFNPVSNALRIVTSADQNLRIANGGAGTVNVDTTLTPADRNIAGAAYSNNVPGGVGGQTTLYVIDPVSDDLLTQGSANFPPGTSPNTGILTLVGDLGVNTSEVIGFDISGDTGIAYAAFNGPPTGGILSQLFTINLVTGAATLVGGFGDGDLQISDITVARLVAAPIAEPASLAVLAFGLLGVGMLRRGRGR